MEIFCMVFVTFLYTNIKTTGYSIEGIVEKTITFVKI